MDPVTVRLTFSDSRRWRPWHGISGDIMVTPLGGGRYRMEDVSSFVPFQFHDEFLATAQPTDKTGREVLVAKERTAKSGYQRWSFIAPGGPRRSAIFQALEALEPDGVRWAMEFGGIFVVSWPPGADAGAIRQRVGGGLDLW